MEIKMTIEEEINKIKVVLLALWKYDIKQEEANKIIEQFEEDIKLKESETSSIINSQLNEESDEEIIVEEVK